ncbi:dimethylaniline monooxygenase 2 [Colletotrichum kahawae]|uniref:Dimethylaniline monooxygenase 2 n=1 Tax=Colletotrichum kahawae TaxID=34407 RepID=A0AAE0D217_COLKA|nr:dimethylaniline monooxygenase 2 [Colletotrichum kahawae]
MVSSQSHSTVGNHVAVIGTGMIGLVAMKNLIEQGLQVTAIEQNEFIGGNWHLSPRKGQTTALPWTSFNTSKQTVRIPSHHIGLARVSISLREYQCYYTDFPFPKDVPTHPPAKDVERYLEAYAENFDLKRHVQFSKVTKIERDDDANRWAIYTRSTKSDVENAADEQQIFDRIVIATGILNVPVDVDIKGINKFEGEALHSRDFKEPNRYEGKNVLVMGVGATGLPRMMNGKAFDHTMSLRAMTIIRTLGDWWPRGCAMLFSKAMVSARRKAFPWLDKHPSFMSPRKLDGVEHRIPSFSNDLADNLRDGSVKAVTGVKEITGPKSVTLTDGTVLDDIDAIIVCSGYHYDFSLIKGAGNPTDPKKAPDNYKRINAAKYKDPHDTLPRLFRGFISEQYPESLAVLGHFLIMGPPFVVHDLATMALSSIWSGQAPIPDQKEMARDIDAHYDMVVETLGRGPVPHMGARMFGSDTFVWLNKIAGTGVTDRLLCFSLDAWKLWWKDRKFYNLLTDGVNSPPLFRLFDTGKGRKTWPGAREAIVANNEDVKQLGEKWKEEQDKKTK